MSRIRIAGWGAVTPAGWGLDPLRQAMAQEQPLAARPMPRPDGAAPRSARLVPPPAVRPPFLAHARLRRSSEITQHTAAAVLEALTSPPPAPDRLGLILCLLTGCTVYSSRFFQEVLASPSTASPLLFPETVFNAPTSHIATLLGGVARATTLIGDPGTFLQGVALGARWIAENRVDRCVVAGAEEVNWLLADALRQFDRRDILGAGAGAVLLERAPGHAHDVILEGVTDAFTFHGPRGRLSAARKLRAALVDNGCPHGTLLVEGTSDRPRTDAAEAAVWRDWTGARLRPKPVLGEGLMAASAWQMVLACDALARGLHPAALVSVVGCNQQAIGARLRKRE